MPYQRSDWGSKRWMCGNWTIIGSFPLFAFTPCRLNSYFMRFEYVGRPVIRSTEHPGHRRYKNCSQICTVIPHNLLRDSSTRPPKRISLGSLLSETQTDEEACYRTTHHCSTRGHRSSVLMGQGRRKDHQSIQFPRVVINPTAGEN